MNFRVTSKYEPSTSRQTEERYYIDGKRVKAETFENKRTLCVIQNKSYNCSNVRLYMSKNGYALFTKTFCYD